jgi:hypothetical protein
MKTLIAGLALCATTMAHGAFIDGNKLHGYLSSGSDIENTHAWGYIAGIADAFNGSSHCLPDNVSVGQLRDVVRKFLSDTPEVRHRPADIIVYVILKNTYPCAEKKKGRPGA